jgi:asparagine N-glycosylation enzyme membrane subunit Stt3
VHDEGLVKAAVVLAIGMLTTATGCVFVDMHHWPAAMSNERVVAVLVAPLVIGVLVGVAVYRILDG